MIFIYLYNIINIILFPIYLCIILIRIWNKKDNFQSMLQRLGLKIKKRPDGNLIWIHAASVGESIMAITIIDNLNKMNIKANYLVTTGTLSSAEILKKKLPNNTIHQFTPIDNLFTVKKFINHWKPKLGIFIESEFWPCLLSQSSKQFDLILINARLSNKSYSRWLNYPEIFQSIIVHFKKVIVQSDSDLKKYQNLGCKNALNLGNLKFSNKKLNIDNSKLIDLQKIFTDKKIFVAASTHKEDEEVVLYVIQKLKNKKLNYYPIIILRHPQRRLEIAKKCRELNLKFTLRSTGLLPSLQDDLYIVDNFGELGLFYKLSFISFIGGSFGSSGGHNIIEPAYFKNIIIVGPNMSNSKNITNDMIKQDAAIQVKNSSDLLKQIEFFLDKDHNKSANKFIENAYQFIDKSESTLDNYMKEIGEFLK